MTSYLKTAAIRTTSYLETALRFVLVRVVFHFMYVVACIALLCLGVAELVRGVVRDHRELRGKRKGIS